MLRLTKHNSNKKTLFVWIIGILRLCGFYIQFDEDASWKRLRILSKIYCALGNVILWINVFRYLTIFAGENRLSGSLMSSLSFLFFWVYFAYTSSTLSLSLPINLRKCFDLIQGHREKIGNREDYFRHLKTVLVIVAILAVCGFALATFALSGTSEDIMSSLRRHITPVNYLQGTAYAVAISFHFVMLFVFGIRGFGTGMILVIMAISLHKEFSFLSKQFEAFLASPNNMSAKQKRKGMNVMESEFETKTLDSNKLSDTPVSETADDTFQLLVESHRRMRTIMDISNKFLSHVISGSYLFMMPIICFLLYGIIRGGLSFDEWILCSLNFVIVTGILTYVTITGILINDKAHSPLQHIFASNWMILSGDQLQKMSLFVTSFTAEKIGFSVYGLFVVDRSTTLMVCGTILTYAFVVLQLNPSSEANCRDNIKNLNMNTTS